MSGSDPAGISEPALVEAVRRLEVAGTEDVSDETVQALLTAGARLYARKVDEEGRDFMPVREAGVLTATDVAVTVTALLRAADLNLFDLAMWTNRAPRGQ
ncbi:MAG: hypothetical protein JJ899_12380 [Alphaproteobacteria bacterium]|nr:hypothetical protein [Alphaproteobacteria bacterium]